MLTLQGSHEQHIYTSIILVLYTELWQIKRSSVSQADLFRLNLLGCTIIRDLRPLKLIIRGLDEYDSRLFGQYLCVPFSFSFFFFYSVNRTDRLSQPFKHEIFVCLLRTMCAGCINRLSDHNAVPVISRFTPAHCREKTTCPGIHNI